ncbi:HEAT repeat domain-containing protein [Lentzea tibetensis]|nr:HEAT repeat domain-containing protein [Lentzea tibetensis]
MTRPFVAESRGLLSTAPVRLPGRELRTSDTAWIDLLGRADSLMVTVFPLDDGQDFDGLWVVAAQPGGRCHYERLDRNGQCVVRGLRPGSWDVGLLEAEHEPQVATTAPAPEFGTLLDAISDEDPIACCEALDALRDAARGETWSAIDIEPVVAQLSANGEAIVRKAAAELLGEVGGPSAAPPLLAAVDDPVWFVQHAAVVSLGLVGAAEISSTLQDVRGDAGRDPAVREAAEEVLARLGQVVHSGWEVHRPSADPVFADPPAPVHPARTAAAAARLLHRIDLPAGVVVEQDGVALLVNPHPSDRGTVVVAVRPGDEVAGLIGSLWSLGPDAHVHSGRFDELAQLRLPGVAATMGYDLRIMGERSTRSVHDLVASSAPVTVRNAAGDAEPATLLVVSDQDGRTVTIRRTGGDVVVAEVDGLGITDRRMVARLPIRTAAHHLLLAPLRWNHRTDRCEARLRLLDSDVVVGDCCLEVWGPGDLEPELADNVTASVPRADPDTAAVWTALAAEPGLHPRITTAIRTAPRGDW